MIWVASLLMFLVIGGGLVGVAVMRRKLRDDAAVHELPPDVLIAIARSHDAKLTPRKSDVETQRDIAKPGRTDGPFRDA